MNTDEITEGIIGCAITVSNALGIGFLEKIYENALAHELRKAGLQVRQQEPIKVHYDGVMVGECIADLVVGDGVIVELKVAKAIDPIHEAQLELSNGDRCANRFDLELWNATAGHQAAGPMIQVSSSNPCSSVCICGCIVFSPRVTHG